MEQEKDGNYALNTWKDIWKYDPARLLDLGNDFQIWLSQKNPEVNEEARATSNFEKLTEGKRRPISHTLVDAARLLPDIIALAAGPGIATAKKVASKKATEKVGSKVAKKLVKERTDDAAKDLTKSFLLARDDKDMAAKAWLRKIWENKEAMNRVAGKNLSDEEIKAVRKAIPDVAKPELESLNTKVDKFKDFLKNNAQLTPKEKDTLMANLKEIEEAGKGASFSHYSADRILKGIPKDKHSIIKDVLFTDLKSMTTLGPVVNMTTKVADAGINDLASTKFKTNKGLEMSPDYWTQGSEPTPVSDFFASVFNVDFDDPARFNKKDIDTFFDFLEDNGIIEPGIKDKWTPRQKVSVMREMLSDEYYGPFVKEKWSKKKYSDGE